MGDTIEHPHRTVLAQADLPRDTHVTFRELVDEGDAADVLTLPAELVEAMGDPDTVTITVEVGDLLNVLPEGYEPELGTASVEQLLNAVHARLEDVGTDTQEVDQLLAALPTEVLFLRGDLP